MSKLVFLFVFISSLLYSDILDDKIQNLITTKKYLKHKYLIADLTKNKDLFYFNNKLKYSNILSMLNKNGLLNLKFNKPKIVKIKFKIETSPLLAMKILKTTLKNLGYSYYFTDNLSLNNTTMQWQISFKSEYIINPYILYKELSKSETTISNITRLSQTIWEYDINVKNSKLTQTINIQKNEKIKLLKPLNAYLLQIKDGNELIVLSQKLNKWFPNITFYKKDLNVIAMIKKTRIYRGVKIKIPKNTYYIRIDDNYSLLNIKRGLTIIVK